ncbi:MAG: bacillithiol biosynthesis cysteine-adding enzyme BshC [Vicinamibacteria bacterium]
MAGRPSPVLDYGAFHHPPNALFRDYLIGSPSVRPFYDGARWDLDALVLSAGRAAARPRPLGALVGALVRQQEERGAAQAAAAARRLGEPGAAVVVTGQQAGLFGGPLFVLYKALAAVQVAAAVGAERGAPVVPVFWVASDDHDFAEVRSVNALDDAGRLRTIRYEPHREPAGQPASRIVLDETVSTLVDELRRCLPESPFRDGMLGRLAQCYAPGATLSGAFAAFLSSLFPALVFLDPSDPELKTLMAPVLAREIREQSPTSRLATEAGERLLAAGYHQQVPVRPGFLNLFVVMDGERRSLGLQNGDVEVRGIGRRIPIEEAAALLEREPGPWSPGVLLRPLAQDHLLPTATYVGGPAEIAYHAQIGPSYGHFGIPRPPLLPRPGVTLVEPGHARVLEAEGLALSDLQGDPEVLVARWAREAYPDVEGAFARARESIDRDLTDVENKLAALDPTLRAAADAARGRALHQIETLREKATRALKKRDQVRADRIRRTRDALFPAGAFQERGLGLIGLLCRHGAAVVDTIAERLDPWATGHQVIHL